MGVWKWNTKTEQPLMLPTMMTTRLMKSRRGLVRQRQSSLGVGGRVQLLPDLFYTLAMAITLPHMNNDVILSQLDVPVRSKSPITSKECSGNESFPVEHL